MQPKDKKAIAHQFGLQSINQFTGWVLSFLEIRNRCAHNDRIYNMPLSTPLALFPADFPYCPGPQNRIFPVIMCLKRITSDKDLWEWFFYELCYLIGVHPEVDLSRIGFPANWEKALSSN
jgi:abortive infection bacteriophage resistance protein